MGRHHSFLFLSILSAAVIFLSSCRRNQLNSETNIAEDNSIAEALWEDVSNQVEGSSSLNESDSLPTWNQCAIIRIDTLGSPFPIIFTADFGEENCLCLDGKYRRGSIIYEATGPYRQSGSLITSSTDDYYVNDYKVEGTRITNNVGVNSEGFHQYEISVTDGKVTTPDNEIISWESQRTRVWMEGSETGYFTIDSINGGFLGWDGITDDVYQITGNASGTSKEGRNFTAEIRSPLVAAVGCRWITQGILVLKPEELLERVFDYGYGDCDNQAVVTIGNRDYDVTLPE
jgi:hypothetical protein